MSVATRRALYGKLSGDTTLTNLLAAAAPGYTKGIYYQQAPASASFPCVIFSKQTGIPTYTFKAGHAAMDDEVWLFKAVDRNSTADAAESIASRLDALLTDGTITISGATALYLRRLSDVDYDETADGEQYKHAGAQFRLIYEQT